MTYEHDPKTSGLDEIQARRLEIAEGFVGRLLGGAWGITANKYGTGAQTPHVPSLTFPHSLELADPQEPELGWKSPLRLAQETDKLPGNRFYHNEHPGETPAA